MAIVPVRGVGDVGVISDLDPQDIPFTAFQDAINTRFSESGMSRYGAFKLFENGYEYTKQPVGILEGGGPTGSGYLVTVFSDGSMEQRIGGTSTDVTPAGTLGVNDDQITTTFLGGLTYTLRPSDVPIYRSAPADGAFAPIPGWDSLDRCGSLRSYKDFLIALDVTKSATNYPVMIKWSDAAQPGSPPANWDVLNLSSLAGENVLNDCRDRLIDGTTLGDSFIVYGESQTFRMDFIGAPLVFRFQQVFSDVGLMARNCMIEVDGRHYVFAKDDIIVHDGFNKQSIANGKIAQRLFSEIDFDKQDRCFVYHDRMQGEVVFCYPSTSEAAQWPLGDIAGCNRGAVYNYRYNTWSFVDLPSLVGWCATSESTVVSWEDLQNWNEMASTWGSYDGQRPSALLVASTGYSAVTAKPYFIDDIDGGRLNNSVALDVQWPAYGDWLYKDLDELGTTIYGRKLIRSLIPQFKTSDPNATVNITVGHSETPNTEISWGTPFVFSPWTDFKYDTRVSGRYMSIRIEYPAGVDVNFSGFDTDVMQIAGR